MRRPFNIPRARRFPREPIQRPFPIDRWDAMLRQAIATPLSGSGEWVAVATQRNRISDGQFTVVHG